MVRGRFGRGRRFATATGASTIVLSQAFHLEIFSDCEERVKLFLGDIHFAVIHEVEHADQVCILDTLEEEQGMLVAIPSQDSPEEGGTGTQDHLVGLKLLVLTGQGDVKEVAFVLELRERLLYIFVKFVPFQK